MKFLILETLASVADAVLCSPEASRNFLLSAIVFSGAAAVGISYTTAWCIRATSSTTYRYAVIPIDIDGAGLSFSLFASPAAW